MIFYSLIKNCRNTLYRNWTSTNSWWLNLTWRTTSNLKLTYFSLWSTRNERNIMFVGFNWISIWISFPPPTTNDDYGFREELLVRWYDAIYRQLVQTRFQSPNVLKHYICSFYNQRLPSTIDRYSGVRNYSVVSATGSANRSNVFGGNRRYRTGPTITVDKRARAGFPLDAVHTSFTERLRSKTRRALCALCAVRPVVFVPYNFDLSVSCGWCFVCRRTHAPCRNLTKCACPSWTKSKSVWRKSNECPFRRIPFTKVSVPAAVLGLLLFGGTRRAGKIWIRGKGLNFEMLIFLLM